MRVIIALVLAVTAVTAIPYNQERIIGGSITTINNYPSMVALLFSWGTTGHRQSCGGSILNNRSVLTAAHCTYGHAIQRWQSRVGSANANSGGLVYTTSQIINHPSYNIAAFLDSDIAIVRISGSFTFTNVIQPGSYPSVNYNLADNQVVWAAGWGRTIADQPNSVSEQLRHVQVWTVNQETCRARYNTVNSVINDNMLCSGWLDVGGRDQCQGDSGGPLYHNGVVVGVTSWGESCALAYFPGVNVRLTRFSSWIQNNA